MRCDLLIALAIVSLLLNSPIAKADETVSIGGSNAVLLRPSTPRASVIDPFIRWAGGKASVKWLDGGVNSGDPCQARGYHGFNGLDGEVVSIAAGFR